MSVPTGLAIAATGASVVAATALPQTLDISIDSRTIARGQTYLALQGGSFDGHAFIAEALGAGATALVVSERGAVPPGVPALVVADTKLALLALGGIVRSRSRARVAGITGSAGKTTTKALLAQILEGSARGSVIATPANENNEIGVAKILLGIPRDAAFAVVELGARHVGDIATLAAVARPDVAILTNVGEAHLEIFGSREALARTKWAIFDGDPLPVLCATDATSLARAASLGRAVVWFATDDVATSGLPPTDTIVTIAADAEGHALRIRRPHATREERYGCTIALAGAHNLANLAAAAAGALALGIEPATIAASFANLELPAGRYERIAVGDFALLYDAYNASASGTIATLASFANESATRRIAVLGSMAELGADAAMLHACVGEAAARCELAALLVGGEFASEIARGARAGGLARERIVAFASNDDAVTWLAASARAGDLVLLKASRRYRLEEIVEGLRTRRGRTAEAHG